MQIFQAIFSEIIKSKILCLQYPIAHENTDEKIDINTNSNIYGNSDRNTVQSSFDILNETRCSLRMIPFNTPLLSEASGKQQCGVWP